MVQLPEPTGDLPDHRRKRKEFIRRSPEANENRQTRSCTIRPCLSSSTPTRISSCGRRPSRREPERPGSRPGGCGGTIGLYRWTVAGNAMATNESNLPVPLPEIACRTRLAADPGPRDAGTYQRQSNGSWARVVPAAVYLARDRRNSRGRPVAVKTPHRTSELSRAGRRRGLPDRGPASWPAWNIPTSSRSTTPAAPTWPPRFVVVLRNIEGRATWPERIAERVRPSRRPAGKLLRRSPRPCSTPTRAGWCIGTSSRPTSRWTPAARRTWPTSAWR